MYMNNKEVDLEDVLGYVPNTWHPIITKLIEDMFEAGWDGNITQVKEKFGGLRFYIQSGNDKIFDLIDDAEQATEEICIICGEPATTISAGWYTHRCETHKDA